MLYPISMLYGIGVWARNRLYDAKLISSIQFSVPVISVGNISTGGTGKTPHIEYLIGLLQYEHHVATMSRGYKRRTRGFYLAKEGTDFREIGDEPMQFHTKFPELTVSVCEDRMTGIPRLLGERPDIDVVLLDDAFQHRSVRPGLNILITDHDRPFYKDYILPFGSLRESRKAYKRADVIIVSKCPQHLDREERANIIKRIAPLDRQRVFFSTIAYRPFIDFYTGGPVDLPQRTAFLVACGIAKPEPLLRHLRETTPDVHLLRYPDHHDFRSFDLEEIRQTFNNWDHPQKAIVVTEKDAARLLVYKSQLEAWGLPIIVLPIEISFLDGADVFNDMVRDYIRKEIEENDAYGL